VPRILTRDTRTSTSAREGGGGLMRSEEGVVLGVMVTDLDAFRFAYVDLVFASRRSARIDQV
jgi:hypothetical protein